MHKLNTYCTELSAKFNMATEEFKSEALLGPACHAKGWTPYFPEFCFINGIDAYPFSYKKNRGSSKSKANMEGTVINPCLEDCVLASDDQFHCVLDIVEKCKSLNRKQLRDYLCKLNECPSIQRAPYLLQVEHRNHPRACFSGDNSCSSGLVVLRKLYPHYHNVRKLYGLSLIHI